MNRPALQRLLEDVRQGKINRILITKLDRLSRGVRNYYKILDTLDEYGVYWSTIFEKYDSSTASGRLHINIMLSVAENEAAQTSERIRSVFKTKLQNNEIVSGKIPVGLKKDGKKLIIDPAKKDFIIDIFDFYLRSNSVYKTLDHVLAIDNTYNYMRIYNMLQNKLYIGIKESKYGKIENYCDAIIEKEKFEKVQKLLKKNDRKRDTSSKGYIFSGLLRCSHCNYKLSGKAYNGYYYYLCHHSRFSKKCNMGKSLNETKIEEKLLEQIVPQLKDYIQQFSIENKKELPKRNVEKEKSDINRQLEKLSDLYIRDIIKIEHYEKQYKELTYKLEDLNKIDTTKSANNANNIKPLKSILNKNFKEKYNLLSRQEKRRVWLSIIDCIYIDEDYNLKIVFI